MIINIKDAQQENDTLSKRFMERIFEIEAKQNFFLLKIAQYEAVKGKEDGDVEKVLQSYVSIIEEEKEAIAKSFWKE